MRVDILPALLIPSPSRYSDPRHQQNLTVVFAKKHLPFWLIGEGSASPRHARQGVVGNPTVDHCQIRILFEDRILLLWVSFGSALPGFYLPVLIKPAAEEEGEKTLHFLGL